MLKRALFIFLLSTLATFQINGQYVNLPIGHWAYSLLDRFETKGYLENINYNSKPFTREEIANIIISISQKIEKGEISLSNTETALFEKLKGEFFDELQNKNIKINPKEKEPHLFTWKEKNSILHYDGYVMEDAKYFPNNKESDYSSRLTMGSIIRGVIEDKIHFYVDFRNTLIKGEDLEKNYNPSYGLPISVAGSKIYSDQAVAYFVYKFQWCEFSIGRDIFSWGPGYRGSLGLSINSEVFDMFRFNLSYKRFKFIGISGILNSEYGRKNIAAHRIEVRITPKFTLAGYETVIYGNRGLELIYVNPIMPYHIAEHYQQDKDNNTMGFDFVYLPIKHFKLYSEIFLDDFNTSKNPFTYYGNKFAFLSGFHWTDPFSIKDTDFKAEYTRIEPYVYTHTYPINTYTNYDRIIGHWIGPNSDYFFTEFSYQYNRPLKIIASFEQKRQGKGDVNIPHKPQDGIRKKFLDGIVENKKSLNLGFLWELKRDMYISFNWGITKTKNAERILNNNDDHNELNLIFWINR
jgi:hypothetical protein